MHKLKPAAWVPALLAAALLCGCSAGLPSLQLGLTSVPKLPSLPELPKLSLEQDPVVGSTTDVYTNVARGALTCWFGSKGPLKGQYIYHGEAEPPSKGGKADIVIHTIDPTAPSPRGLRAYRVAITPEGPEGERTALTIENFKMAEPLASRMSDDVRRWAAAQTGCGAEETKAGWAAKEAEPVADKVAAGAKQKKR